MTKLLNISNVRITFIFILLCTVGFLPAQQTVLAEWLTLNAASPQPTWTQKPSSYYYHTPTAKSSNNQNVEFRFIDVPNISQVITPKTNAINKPFMPGSNLADGIYFKYSLIFTNNFSPDDYYSTTISTEGYTNITVNSYLFGAITNASDPTKMILQYVIGGGNPVDVSTYSLPTKNIAYEFTASLPQSCEGLTSLELRWVVKSYAGGVNMSNVGIATSIKGTPASSSHTVSNSSNISALSLSNSTDLIVDNGAELNINANATIKSLTVSPTGKVTFTGSNTLSATNGITLESDADGTATLVDEYNSATINATVKQYVTAGRNWYMSAPLNAASFAVLNKGFSLAEYNESTGLFPTVTTGTLTPGKGYIQIASSTQGTTGSVSFAGTTNSGNIPVTLTNNSGGGKGFNLVGNPYPSYLSWSAVVADNAAANMPTGTMWYRTINYNSKSAWTPNTVYNLDDIIYNGTRFYKVTTAGTSAASVGPTGNGNGIIDGTVLWSYEGSVYIFATVNSVGQATPSTVSNLIPPMQAFWVKSTGGTLTFKNSMRSHGSGTNKLKAPKSTKSEFPLVRLCVTNGASVDEAVIYASDNASNDLDASDAPKFFNTSGYNQAELYTQCRNEKLAINALNRIESGTTLALGFFTEKENRFSIKAIEINNLNSNLQVLLKDNQKNTEFNLTNGDVYEFISEPGNNANRFSLIFTEKGTTTSLENNQKSHAFIYLNSNNQIVISNSKNSIYSICNILGTLLESGVVNSETEIRNLNLTQGIYLVKVNNITQKIVIN